MNTSDVISIFSVLVACLSALYARWASIEARRANEIAVHDKRMEIYKAFDTLRFAMLQKACSITHEDIGFYFPSRDSEFYFPTDMHNKLKQYFDLCFALAEWHRKEQRGNLSDGERSDIHKQQDQLLSQESCLSKEIDVLLRKELKIVL